jgi:hypothetical protein
MIQPDTGGANGTYNEAGAANYANQWAKSHNPAYRTFPDDCTNFVSQAMAAGGKGQTPSWYYNSNGQSGSWINANNLASWLYSDSPNAIFETEWGPNQAYNAQTPSTIWKGDVLFYEWNPGDLKMDHASMQEIGYGYDGQSGLYGSLVDTHTDPHYGAIWSLWPWNASVNTTYYYLYHINSRLSRFRVRRRPRRAGLA